MFTIKEIVEMSHVFKVKENLGMSPVITIKEIVEMSPVFIQSKSSKRELEDVSGTSCSLLA